LEDELAMNHLLLIPPIALLVYVVLVGLVARIGRWLVGPVKESPTERTTYAGGEAPPRYLAAPGYRQFFVIALFFGILHLGVLVLGSEGQTLTAVIYLAGLSLALVALVLG
jgi:NADH:ubiquinone oxidoreductase subunit 3 (subunit A)